MGPAHGKRRLIRRRRHAPLEPISRFHPTLLFAFGLGCAATGNKWWTWLSSEASLELLEWSPISLCVVALNFFFFLNKSLYLAGSSGRLSQVRHGSHKSSATHSYQSVQYFLASKQLFYFFHYFVFHCFLATVRIFVFCYCSLFLFLSLFSLVFRFYCCYFSLSFC